MCVLIDIRQKRKVIFTAHSPFHITYRKENAISIITIDGDSREIKLSREFSCLEIHTKKRGERMIIYHRLEYYQ